MTARRWGGLGLVFLVVAAAAAGLYYPVLLLGLGVQAIGADAGWWIGEPTSNDGEALIATILGAIACLVILVATGFAVRAIALRAGLPSRSTSAICLTLLVVAATVFGIAAF